VRRVFLYKFLTDPSPVRRADYADDEDILDLIKWKHPHTADDEDILYTEEENLTMLRLPRKECLSVHRSVLTLVDSSFLQTSRRRPRYATCILRC